MSIFKSEVGVKHFKSRFFMLLAAALLCFSSPVFAGDINAGLDTADGSSKFSVKDSGDSEVAFIASDGSTYIKGDVGIGTTDTSTGKLVVNGNIAAAAPTADDHVATKGYVDASSGGGCGPVWRGYTTTKYTGNMGGFRGMNMKCHSEYAGSHACTYDELVRLGSSYPATSNENTWVVDGSYREGQTGHLVTKDGASRNTSTNPYNCRGWREGGNAYYGAVAGDDLVLVTCDMNWSIPCCE